MDTQDTTPQDQSYYDKIYKTNNITSETLNNNQSLVTLPTIKTDNTNYAGIIASGVSKTNSNEMPAYLKSLIESSPKPESNTDIYNNLYSTSGIDEKTKKVNDLTAQLESINAEASTANLTLEGGASGKDVTTQFLSRQQQEVTRQAAIKALPIQAQLSAAQGNLQAAEDKINTLFSIKSKDAENIYNYNKELRDKVFEYADKKEQEQLTAQQRSEDKQFTLMTSNLSNARNVANSIISSQPELAAQISAIDWTQPDAEKTFAKLQSQVRETPDMILDRQIKQAQLYKIQKETSLLGEPTSTEKAKEAAKLKTEQGIKDTMQEKVDLIDTIKSSGGESARVGTSPLTRKGVGWENVNPLTYLKVLGDTYSDLSGKGQQFAGGVHRLASQEFLDALIGAKQQGATFGALTDREGDALRAAATQLNDWEIKDKSGKGLGIWNIDQKSFDTELNRIKTLAQKAINGNNVFSDDEQSLLDNVFGQTNVADFYK